ncbi:MAG: CRISPR-associated endonuclease Cas1 [Sulfurimonas sp. RIFCSPHIGHO2_12_FULL_36_9]|nr:MAG: CRISPR-associated endonuclease Cas1 [Sulfurimonas sp. RIFCSPHIGHO2_12_FULL_36_9]OHD99253.1 MAG: CRISPR-associated endonuclease Cas1 [Sulfurimonas sp. RIFCSPLOWO2_02_FULL_36_28]
MYTPSLEHIFTHENFKTAFSEISSKSSGLDDISYAEFKGDFSKNIDELTDSIIKGAFTPEPLKKIEIDKPQSDEKRPIALSAIKDKLVQRVLYKALNGYFDETFSDKSYAYRPDKSTLRAINRVTQFLNEKNLIVVKTDIDNFFESIDHDILLKILDFQISDKRIIRLISLFVQTGGFKEFNYADHDQGVHQGDILSPLLSNIYLDAMDKYLEKHEVPFVRYADDFVMLFKKESEAKERLEKLKTYLLSMNLKLEDEKTYISHIGDGFTFLGVRFEGRGRNVENERLQKSISKIHTLAKDKSGFMKYIKDLNTYLFALQNYYLKIVTKNSTQHQLLQNALIESIAHKVHLSKESKAVTTKKEFKILLAQIEFSILFEDEQLDDKKELIIAKGYEKYLANKSYKDTSSKIDKKKNQYAKKFANDSTLHINTHGLMLGISKNKFVIKEYGKVKSSYPFDKVTRIIFEGKGFSISSDVLKKCADNAITVDFIDANAMPYASLVTYRSTMSQSVHKQAMVLNTSKQLELASAFIKGKAKNQINYLKYLNKYHNLLDKHINSMELNFIKIKSVADVAQLMGIEGSISASYWSGVKLILEVPFESRITHGAKDIVNSSLNYAYAILYGKVQHSLVHAGLSLSISFLHALDDKKPTLTFDMIEEFRTFIVDRTIIAMLNKDEPIKLGNDGLLTKPSRQLIAKNIKEKLGSYTMWKKESRKMENIIQTQCFNLAKTINGESAKYKAFIGKY